MNLLRPTRFALARLTLLDVGALRGLTNVSLIDADNNPTNLFLIMGPNGAGKTTVLESIYTAMRLLNERTHTSYGMEALDRYGGGIQLDAVVTLDDGFRSEPRVISIVLGEAGLLHSWTKADLEAVGVNVPQIVLQFGRGTSGAVERLPKSDPEAVSFADAILERLGEAPQALFETSVALPTVLYFPSDRGIRRPPEEGRAITRPVNLGYNPVHRFDIDGASWDESIDNLLVWFTWLGDDREARCREVVNDLVFHGSKQLLPVNRQTLSVPIRAGDHEHRLDQLSSGERQLVQLIVRIAAHMTGSTIVLIDEIEQHLHLVMRRRLINIIKDWARDIEGLSFVMTSHQIESMRFLGPKMKEPKLYKSGCLVKPKYRPSL